MKDPNLIETGKARPHGPCDCCKRAAVCLLVLDYDQNEIELAVCAAHMVLAVAGRPLQPEISQ